MVILTTLSQNVNQWLGLFLLRHGIQWHYKFTSHAMHDNPKYMKAGNKAGLLSSLFGGNNATESTDKILDEVAVAVTKETKKPLPKQQHQQH